VRNSKQQRKEGKIMYAIMGITGQVGGATARTLIKEGKRVRGIVRDKAKASAWEAAGVELAVADAGDAAALEAAFRGAEGVFLMVPPNFAPARATRNPVPSLPPYASHSTPLARTRRFIFHRSVRSEKKGWASSLRSTFWNRNFAPCRFPTLSFELPGLWKTPDGTLIQPVHEQRSMRS
jgi:hypothetical protein